jgi:hypothetical protein
VSRSVLPHRVEHTAEAHRVASVTSSPSVVSSEIEGFVILTCICLTARLFRMTLVTVPHTQRTSS